MYNTNGAFVNFLESHVSGLLNKKHLTYSLVMNPWRVMIVSTCYFVAVGCAHLVRVVKKISSSVPHQSTGLRSASSHVCGAAVYGCNWVGVRRFS
jgi:hypothetical protein